MASVGSSTEIEDLKKCLHTLSAAYYNPIEFNMGDGFLKSSARSSLRDCLVNLIRNSPVIHPF